MLCGRLITPVRSQPKWNYRIKVFPWMVFGIVKWRIKPVNIAVQEAYAANILSDEIVGIGAEVRIWRAWCVMDSLYLSVSSPMTAGRAHGHLRAWAQATR